MKVYVVSGGERAEGSDVISVFKSKKKAVKEATKLAQNSPIYEHKENPTNMIWYIGDSTDFIQVSEHKLIE